MLHGGFQQTYTERNVKAVNPDFLLSNIGVRVAPMLIQYFLTH